MHGSAIVREIRPILFLILTIWALELVNQLLGHRLNQWFGLAPRSIGGLIGIPAMPFLHGGLSHAAANTLPLLILGGIGLAVAPGRFWPATIVIVLISGIAVWTLARSGIVVGASGLIFGWFGFVIALAALERSLRALLGALLAIMLYGGIAWGVVPENSGQVSWEAHLFGALSGAAAARLFQERRG